jgi:hypothetical protein
VPERDGEPLWREQWRRRPTFALLPNTKVSRALASTCLLFVVWCVALARQWQGDCREEAAAKQQRKSAVL